MAEDRYPIRWRVADFFDGPLGRPAIIAIGVAAVAVVVAWMLFRGFVGRPAEKDIGQTEVRCRAAIVEFRRPLTSRDSQNSPARVCVEQARARLFTTGIFSFFILLFTALALVVNWDSLGGRRKRSPEWDEALRRQRSRN